MTEAMAGIVRSYYKAFAPPMQINTADDAIRALDMIIAGDKLPVGDAIILARRIRRYIQDHAMSTTEAEQQDQEQ